RGGVAIYPTAVRGLGRALEERLVSARTAFWITDILSDDDARAYAFGRGGSLEFPFAVAAKTGTSQAYHDNWAIGYTRAVTVGVWVGNFDRTPLVGSSGVGLDRACARSGGRGWRSAEAFREGGSRTPPGASRAARRTGCRVGWSRTPRSRRHGVARGESAGRRRLSGRSDFAT